MASHNAPESIEALAAELHAIAEGIDSTNYRFEGLKGAQLVRRLDRDAAEQLWHLVASSGYPRPDLMMKGVLEGVASAALIDGVSSTGVSPSSVINIHNISQSSAVANASAAALSRLDAILAESDIPEEARREVEALKQAINDRADKASLLQRAAKVAAKLKEFPLLMVALADALKTLL
jgi:hypothetical protein